VIPAGALLPQGGGCPCGRQVQGRFLLQIKLDRVTVHGRSHSIQTSSVARSQKGKGKRTAAMIAGAQAPEH